MEQRRRSTAWMPWVLVVGVWGTALGVDLPGDLRGVGAIAASAAELSTWQFNPDRQQLEILLPNGTTPRYFLLAQPARIVLDLPDVQAGAASGEQTYSGAVRRVRVAQFEPGLTRIVLELNPDVILAPEQVELTSGETLASGETRWTLRPLLAAGEPTQPPADLAAIPPAPAPPPEPPPIPAPPSPEPASLPRETVPSEMSAPAVSSIPPQELENPVPDTELMEPPQAASPDLAVAPIPDLGAENPLPAAMETGPPTAEPLPMDLAGPADIPTSDSPDSPDSTVEVLPPSEVAAPVEPPASLSEILDATETPVMTEAPRLADEIPLLEEGGADALTTPPAASLAVPSTDLQPVEPSPNPVDDTLTSETFPDAIEIPIDFPSPTQLEVGAPPSNAPTLPPPLPATNNPVAIAVPSLEEPAPPPSPIATAPTDPNLLIPAGARLQLRYPRTSALALPNQPWQEVLVVANPVQDAGGAVLIPAGSQVIGRFEPNGRGYRFVAQAIALNETVLQLQGTSDVVAPDGAIAPNMVIELEITQDLERSPES